jgi:hypothetical protein
MMEIKVNKTAANLQIFAFMFLPPFEPNPIDLDDQNERAFQERAKWS